MTNGVNVTHLEWSRQQDRIVFASNAGAGGLGIIDWDPKLLGD